MTNNTAHYERADQLKKFLVGSLKFEEYQS